MGIGLVEKKFKAKIGQKTDSFQAHKWDLLVKIEKSRTKAFVLYKVLLLN